MSCVNLQVIIYKRDVTVFTKMIIYTLTSFSLTSYLYELYYMIYMYHILNEEDIYNYTSIEKGNRNGEQQNTFLYFVTLYQQESCGMHMYENTHIFLFLKKVFFTILRFVSHEYKTHILQFHALCNIFFKFVWGQDNNKYKRYIYTFKNIIHIFVP